MRAVFLLPFALASCARIAPSTVPLPPAAAATLEALPRQQLRPGECGLYLWAQSPPRLVIALSPTSARIARAGRTLDLPLSESDGDPVLGFTPGATYGGPDLRITLALVIEERRGLMQGAAVPSGSARLTQPDGTEITLPVAGLVGCQ